MKKNLVFFFLSSIFFLLMSISAHASLVTSEDFENGAYGWNNNTTTYGGSNFTNFLGRQVGSRGNQALFKDFSLSGNQTEVTIQFDFYEIDSWDDELFNIYVDDTLLRSDRYWFRRQDSPDDTTELFTGNKNQGFGSWNDQAIRYTFTYLTSGTSLRLGFGSSTNQSINDESFGIDNVIITDNFSANPVPEPTTFLLFGLGIFGLAGFVSRKKA